MHEDLQAADSLLPLRDYRRAWPEEEGGAPAGGEADGCRAEMAGAEGVILPPRIACRQDQARNRQDCF